jgi:tetratricopeptide (TPR) repeat protein
MNRGFLALIIFVVLVVAVRTAIRRSARRPPAAVGRSGPVPLSSAALNAELFYEAQRGLSKDDASRIQKIFGMVDHHDYTEAIDLISGMLGTQCSVEVRVLLLWIKSNVYARTQRVAQEVATLAELIPLKTHPLFELNVGVAKAKLKQFDDAKTHYRRAIDLMEGSYPLAVYNLGILYCAVGDKDSAAQQLHTLKRFGRDVPRQLIEKLARRVSEL